MHTMTEHHIGAAPAAAPITSGILTIEAMPSRLRPVVEQLMVDCLRTESTWVVPGDDPLNAQWCTRWHKDWPGEDLASLAAGTARLPAGIGCRQVLTGTHSELEQLSRALAQLAENYCFSARVTM